MSSRTNFFINARQSKSKYACEKTWARHFARVYYHEIDANSGFLTIYNQLLSGNTVEETRSNRILRSPVLSSSNKNAVIKRTDNMRVTRSSTRSSSCEQTDTEQKSAKQELNRILYKEYNDWYDAFEAEASEDNMEDISADDRWSLHAAKALSRKTGISVSSLMPVVQAWLLEKSVC